MNGPRYLYHYSFEGDLILAVTKDGNDDPKLKTIARKVKREEAPALAKAHYEKAAKFAAKIGRAVPTFWGMA